MSAVDEAHRIAVHEGKPAAPEVVDKGDTRAVAAPNSLRGGSFAFMADESAQSARR